jgi:hypothetical protein
MNKNDERSRKWELQSNGRWDFLVNGAVMAMVKGPNPKEGYYFWEHWPWMGHYGRVGDLEHAKKCAAAPWGGESEILPENASVEARQQ